MSTRQLQCILLTDITKDERIASDFLICFRYQIYELGQLKKEKYEEQHNTSAGII